MRQNLLNMKQPFGSVQNHKEMPAPMNGPEGSRNAPGSEKVVGNNGFDHAPPIKDNPNPGAEAYACRNYDNPFAWTGKPGR
jgi:hypothetical protein